VRGRNIGAEVMRMLVRSGDVRQASTTKTLLVVFAILGGLGLIAVLVCAGFGYWVYKGAAADFAIADPSAQTFLDRVRDGQFQTAYQSTSQSFRAAQTLDEFIGFINRHATFKSHTSRTLQDWRVRTYPGTGKKLATIQVTLRAPDNATTCTLVLVEEGGQWKVEKLTVP
jgi:hypothetical protein